jgi:hypothetical protein
VARERRVAMDEHFRVIQNVFFVQDGEGGTILEMAEAVYHGGEVA